MGGGIWAGGTAPSQGDLSISEDDDIICGGGRVGLRRRFKAPISSEARV